MNKFKFGDTVTYLDNPTPYIVGGFDTLTDRVMITSNGGYNRAWVYADNLTLVSELASSAPLPTPTNPQPPVPSGPSRPDAPDLPGINAPIITQTVEILWTDTEFRQWLLKREDIRRATLEALASFVKSL